MSAPAARRGRTRLGLAPRHRLPVHSAGLAPTQAQQELPVWHAAPTPTPTRGRPRAPAIAGTSCPPCSSRSRPTWGITGLWRGPPPLIQPPIQSPWSKTYVTSQQMPTAETQCTSTIHHQPTVLGPTCWPQHQTLLSPSLSVRGLTLQPPTMVICFRCCSLPLVPQAAAIQLSISTWVEPPAP